jgi:hypothetical protein
MDGGSAMRRTLELLTACTFADILMSEGDAMPSRIDNLTTRQASSRRMMMPRAWSVTGSGIMP